MQNILIVALVLFLTQTVKFFLRIFFYDKKLDKDVIWVYFWATGIPSAHSAFLTSGLFLLYEEVGFDSAVFLFSCIVSIVFMYNLVETREREVIRKHEFFFKDKGVERKVIDISGHKFIDIVTGILAGFVFTYILVQFI